MNLNKQITVIIALLSRGKCGQVWPSVRVELAEPSLHAPAWLRLRQHPRLDESAMLHKGVWLVAASTREFDHPGLQTIK